MKKESYVRDKRSPVPKSESVSRVMSANKAGNTKPEVALRKALWKRGARGYRVNYKKLPGRPDIVFVSKKVAVFVHGCYWHRCPKCNMPLPKNNTDFWKNKFEKNVERDKKNVLTLQASGWNCIVIWECELESDLDEVASRILTALDQSVHN